jgi:hypothetical protein
MQSVGVVESQTRGRGVAPKIGDVMVPGTSAQRRVTRMLGTTRKKVTRAP